MTQVNDPATIYTDLSESYPSKGHGRGGFRPNSGKPKGTIHVSPDKRLTKMMRVPESTDVEWLRSLPVALEAFVNKWDSQANSVWNRSSSEYKQLRLALKELQEMTKVGTHGDA